MASVPFSRPNLGELEKGYLLEAFESRHISGDGPFTKRCNALLEDITGARRALLTHSCTGALEMSVLLAELGPGDEVIMPSYTFVSTANAVALRGATPVFVDIRPDTLNLNEALIEQAITPKTKAIFVVHYAGVACEMDAITEIAKAHGLLVLEDAAQGLQASYKGQALGTIGAAGAISFHETKNLVSGEGGALLVNDPRLINHAEIVREKGTDRSRFLRGEVDKYTWQDIGSSYLPSDMVAAVMLAQLERIEELTEERLRLWSRYEAGLADLTDSGVVQAPSSPAHCTHNGHIFFLILKDEETREVLRHALLAEDLRAHTHYVPLHLAPAGKRFGRVAGSMEVTERTATNLLRLPLWNGLPEVDQDRVIAVTHKVIVQT